MRQIILLLIAAAICLLIALIAIRNRRSMNTNRQRAAAILMREHDLERALARKKDSGQGRRRLLLELSFKTAQKENWVFDPSVPITIGRSPVLNQISIREDSVSATHCCVFYYQGKIYVQDLDSANGTWIRRRFQTLRVNRLAYLQQGDALIVGNLVMHVRLFLFDTAYM